MGNKAGGKKKLQTVMFKDSSLKFDAAELQELKMKFETFAERSKGPNVDKLTFLRVFPLPGILGERLFTLFDVDGSGVLDYEEFICGLALFCRGSQEERLRVMFDMYDLAGDGAIHKKELGILFSHMPKGMLEASGLARRIRENSLDQTEPTEGNEKPLEALKVGDEASDVLVDVQELVEQAFKDCDLNRDGKLSYHQFNLWVNQNPDLAGWLDHQMNEQVFEAAGVLSGSKKNSHLTPGHFGEALVSPEVGADKAPFGMQCRFCGYRYLFCTSCGAKFSAKTECVYTSIDGRSPTDIAKNSEGQENGSAAVVRAQGDMASVWRIICEKCNAMSKIGYCGGCGIRATKETFVNCAVSETHLPPAKASLSPTSEFGRSIFSN
eukprot:g4127.t1